MLYKSNPVPVKADYDVIIVGGGIAGVSAAIAASRYGCKVLIIEKNVMLGGLATIGYVNKYLPLCDGHGVKVCASICEELLYDAIKYGYNSLPDDWKSGTLIGESDNRYMSVFSPYDFVLALDEKVEACGINLLYDTIFSMPVMKGSSCEAVIVENKGGRSAYRAKAFVDATGDADLMYRAGVPCKTQDNWLSIWGYVTSFEYMKDGIDRRDILNGVPLYQLGANDWGRGGDKYPKYDGIDPESRTKFMIAGRKLIKECIIESQHQGITTVALPHIPQFRTTRRIIGAYEITVSDVNKHQPRSVGCAPDWRKRGEVYEVPFDALYSTKANNIVAAGRCISASGDSWEVTRVIPACAVTGQAAGTACGMAVKKGSALTGINVKELQQALADVGVLLNYKAVATGRSKNMNGGL